MAGDPLAPCFAADWLICVAGRRSLSRSRKPLEQKRPVCCYQHIYNLRRWRRAGEKKRSGSRWWVIWGMRSIRDQQHSAGCSANAIEIAAMGTSSNSHELVDWLWLALSQLKHLLLSWRRASWRCQWQDSRISLLVGQDFSFLNRRFSDSRSKQRQRPFWVSEHFLTHTQTLRLDEQSASRDLDLPYGFLHGFEF